jgi:hypothetical protein
MVTPNSFRRPTVVTFTQIGQKFGTESANKWAQLTLRSLRASTVSDKDKPSPAANPPGKESTREETSAKTKEPVGAVEPEQYVFGFSGSEVCGRPVDYVSIRSMDVFWWKFTHPFYVRRLAKVVPNDQAKHVFVGAGLIKPFFDSMQIRNPLEPMCFLVDHCGYVRWMSGGAPDVQEEALFPKLLSQLEIDYMLSKRSAVPPRK